MGRGGTPGGRNGVPRGTDDAFSSVETKADYKATVGDDHCTHTHMHTTLHMRSVFTLQQPVH